MKFEVGKYYYCTDCGFDPIAILKRTDKSIWVDNGCSTWCMRIKHDEDGNEFAVDSSSPSRWRGVFTYCADREAESYNQL